jgi:leucyl/phenylalanyl-tRNA--protein transferase
MFSEEVVGWSDFSDVAVVLEGYRRGWFPLPATDRLIWIDPEIRAVYQLSNQRLYGPRSVIKLIDSYEVGINIEPLKLVDLAASVPRPGGWIDDLMKYLYSELLRLGNLITVEVRHDGSLIGGLFGIPVGAVFVGESMVSTMDGASKLAFCCLTGLARDSGFSLIDGQWMTPHLTNLGFNPVKRTDYKEMFRKAASRDRCRLPAGPAVLDRSSLRDLIANR